MDDLKTSQNPLFLDDPSVDLCVGDPVTHRKDVRTRRRDIRDLRRVDCAAKAIAGLDRETEIFAFTKGQFSMVELLTATLDITGPAHLSLSTWTAAHTDLTRVKAFVESGRLTGTRWLVDFSFQRRAPELAAKLRSIFGHDAVRVAKNNAKFSVLTNAEWKVVIRTSMNLNTNPRFEDFTIAHDPELADFLEGILDEVWNRQGAQKANDTPYEIVKHFENDL